MTALARDFEAHGEEVFKRVRRESPASYLKVCAMLVPKELKFEHSGGVKAMTDEQLELMPDAKECISESIDNPEVLCDLETWDRPGFTLVLSWQKWLQKCHNLVPRGSKNPQQHLTKEPTKGMS